MDEENQKVYLINNFLMIKSKKWNRKVYILKCDNKKDQRKRLN